LDLCAGVLDDGQLGGNVNHLRRFNALQLLDPPAVRKTGNDGFNWSSAGIRYPDHVIHLLAGNVRSIWIVLIKVVRPCSTASKDSLSPRVSILSTLQSQRWDLATMVHKIFNTSDL